MESIENWIEEMLNEKKLKERDYVVAYKTEEETYYLDQEYNVLIHCIRKFDCKCYLLEIEETKKQNGMCTFSVYALNSSKPAKKMVFDFDSYGSTHNKAFAAKIFRMFRDSDAI